MLAIYDGTKLVININPVTETSICGKPTKGWCYNLKNDVREYSRGECL